MRFVLSRPCWIWTTAFWIGFCLAAASHPAAAQQGRKRPASGAGTAPLAAEKRGAAKESNTSVEVELLVVGQGVMVNAQRWTNVFAELNTAVKITPAGSQGTPSVSEQTRGELRFVKLVGVVDRSSAIRFPDRTIQFGDRAGLKSFLNELREYGSQGSPEGKPGWGLSLDQFRRVFDILGKPMRREIRGDRFEDALLAFQFGNELSVVVTDEAAALVRKAGPDPLVRNAFEGVSKGTALAAMLNEFDLAFQPRRRNNGSIDLVVVPFVEGERYWQIGWETPKGHGELLPKLFDFVPVDLDNVEIRSVLDTISGLLDTPILIDESGLRLKKTEFEGVLVSHPPKKTAWALALKELLRQVDCRYEIYLDEARQPFIWVTPLLLHRRTPEEQRVDEAALSKSSTKPATDGGSKSATKVPGEKPSEKEPTKRKKRPPNSDPFGDIP
jgi:hypothetical protein